MATNKHFKILQKKDNTIFISCSEDVKQWLESSFPASDFESYGSSYIDDRPFLYRIKENIHILLELKWN